MERIVNHLKHSSLSTRILVALALGIIAGLFFGEKTLHLQWVADAWIRLMQMTVLPFVMMSLIAGLAQMNADLARKLAWRGGLLLVVFWAIGFIVVAAMPLAFPEYQSASFFSAYAPDTVVSFNPIELYIPSNPFHSMANTVIPAVVLFSAAIGVAMIGLPNKTALLESINTFIEALTRVTRFIVALTPLGLFAIAAVSAGTMTWAEIERLEVYFVVYIVGALYLTFWVLPVLVTTLTPFRYRDVLSYSKEALLMAFVTQNLFIVLPMLVDTSRQLFKDHAMQAEDTDTLNEVIVPVAFNFPNAGKLLSLLFIPFAAWLSGSSMDVSSYPGFLSAGLASYFAKAQVALPFLLDLHQIPQDFFQVYLTTGIINGKFDTMTSAMNLLAFSLLGTAALTGYLKIKPLRLLTFIAASALILALLVFGTKELLKRIIDTSYNDDMLIRTMSLMDERVPMQVYMPGQVPPMHETRVQGEPGPAPGTMLERIRDRGVLRAGYNPERLPFTFFNDERELVGFDVELLNLLASEMGVSLEFIPVSWDTLSEEFEASQIDIMGTVPLSTRMLVDFDLSDPYLQGTLSLVVRDHRRAEFSTRKKILAQTGLSIAYAGAVEYIRPALERALPGDDFTWHKLSNISSFFEQQDSQYDALLVDVEIGTAWTLLNPEYTVVIPQASELRMPSGFAVAKGQHDLSALLGRWIAAKKSTGELQVAYNYWILGDGAEKKEPRWSIGKDVLHWFE
jgi:Na+/H+-dicarboxylate symporter/ABC-type amino acid transport substrate-binding protein